MFAICVQHPAALNVFCILQVSEAGNISIHNRLNMNSRTLISYNLSSSLYSLTNLPSKYRGLLGNTFCLLVILSSFQLMLGGDFKLVFQHSLKELFEFVLQTI